MDKLLPIIETPTREVYRVGKFTFDAEDATVIISKDTQTGIISLASHYYGTHERACEMAWRMAERQRRA